MEQSINNLVHNIKSMKFKALKEEAYVSDREGETVYGNNKVKL